MYYKFLIVCCVFSLFHFCHGIDSDILEEKSPISNKELKAMAEELFEYVRPDILQSLSIDYQGRRTFNSNIDEAPQPLFQNLPSYVFDDMKTVRLLRKLYDNYDMDSRHEEVVTKEEEAEENNFIDSLLNTRLMMKVMDFLANKGYFPKGYNEYRNVLKSVWFDTYSRNNQTKAGSSGFEHVFTVERKKGNHVTGLHNWIFFATEEAAQRLNYLGYVAKDDIADKAVVIKLYISHMGRTSTKVTSMFIGTPPEFDVALYTLCFFARANKTCKVTLGDAKVIIQTYVQYADHNKRLLATSYPLIYRNKD